MQLIALPLCVTLMSVAALPASAQGDLKIGFVNVPYIIQNAPQTAVLERRLRNEFAERQAELESAIESWQESGAEFERDADVMAAEERTERERDLTARGRELERRQEDLQEDINFRQNELLNELQNSVGRAVQAYVEGEGYDLVLTQAVYVSDAIDITEEVLTAISPPASE
jgi:outer membrane protein